jgi:hypothetical protein
MLECFVSLALPELEYVNAQQPDFKAIILDKFSQDYVAVDYQSPTTVIISGDLVAPGLVGGFNTGLWGAMDLLKNQYTFKIQQIMTSGVGSEGNPTVVYILMTK